VFSFWDRKFAYTVITTPEWGSSSVSRPDSENIIERFRSGGDPSDGNFIPVYLTSTTNQSYRLCERIRFTFSLKRDQLTDILRDTAQLSAWYAIRFNRW